MNLGVELTVFLGISLGIQEVVTLYKVLPTSTLTLTVVDHKQLVVIEGHLPRGFNDSVTVFALGGADLAPGSNDGLFRFLAPVNQV